MPEIKDLDYVKSQLTIARWHLDRGVQPDPADPEQARNHLAEARGAYEHIMDLLPTLNLSGTRRVSLVTELAALRDRLRAAGEEL
jgi:hypothetical protein